MMDMYFALGITLDKTRISVCTKHFTAYHVLSTICIKNFITCIPSAPLECCVTARIKPATISSPADVGYYTCPSSNEQVTDQLFNRNDMYDLHELRN
jgi:hypothetical protein